MQATANMFINLNDRTLRYLTKSQEVQSIELADPIIKIKQEGSPLGHFKKVKYILGDVRHDIGDANYHKLLVLFEPLKNMSEQFERPTDLYIEPLMVEAQ